VIDMGGGVTSIAVFLEGHLVHADVVPVGGFSVTNDIASMLAAPLSAAERAKTLYGAAMGEMDGGADVVSIAQMGEDGDDAALRLPRSMLTRIIQARLEEIFGEVQTRLRASGFDVAAGRRAVLTGGACLLPAIRLPANWSSCWPCADCRRRAKISRSSRPGDRQSQSRWWC